MLLRAILLSITLDLDLDQRALLNPGELSQLAEIFKSTNSARPLSKCDLKSVDIK